MQIFNIPDTVIKAVAAQIHSKTNRDYHIPVVGVAGNLETPQVFEIIPFEQIDARNAHFYAIDGSSYKHIFYNGVCICFYQAGYICFHKGRQIRMNTGDDPVTLGKIFHGTKMLVLNEKDLSDIYDELMILSPVESLLAFLGDGAEEVFAYKKDALITNASSLLGFCQEVLEWACIYDIVCNAAFAGGDIILRDGALRSLYIKQRYLAKLGYLIHDKKAFVLGITKQNPIKTELSYTLYKIDNYLQSQLKDEFPFKSEDPKKQKLCCYFEVRDDVLASAYESNGNNMYIKKDIIGGRGFGLFFAARLDYVEKLQNYDWIICDLNIYDCIPGVANRDQKRDYETIAKIMFELTATTQEHYILGYPYPLVEAHNLVSLTSDFQNEAIARVKNALYSSQSMDHTDIENLFLDLHSRF